jgi:predicted Zn-dependent protease
VVAVAAGRGTNPLLVDQVANVVYGLPNSREQESEADRMGLELMARAGYDPQAAITLWQKMAAKAKGGGPPAFLSTHPSHAERIAELQRLQAVAQPLYQQARAKR